MANALNYLSAHRNILLSCEQQDELLLCMYEILIKAYHFAV